MGAYNKLYDLLKRGFKKILLIVAGFIIFLVIMTETVIPFMLEGLHG